MTFLQLLIMHDLLLIAGQKKKEKDQWDGLLMPCYPDQQSACMTILKQAQASRLFLLQKLDDGTSFELSRGLY